MGSSGGTGRHGALEAYRQVIGLTGPLLPAVSFLGRLPTATIQFGSVLLVARTSGSLAAAGLTGGALAVGQVACAPLVGRLADRHGQRTVVLVLALVNALAIAALVAGALAGAATPVLVPLGAVAGASVPLIGPLARARLLGLARRARAPESTVGAALSFESALDEVSFVLGPALVGLAAVFAHPAYALAGAAVLVAGCGTAFALHPTARAAAPSSAGDGGTRPRMPRAVHALRASLALQGAMFGACQAGITALTERLGQPEQAGLVYAAMGVMSAVAGLAMAAVPARFGLRARWRAATATACALSLPLLWTDSLAGLYVVVTVLGTAYAPHLITVSALTERVVPRARLAEAMAFATSAVVGGQALAVVVTGRLAESHGPAAAFGVACAAAGTACVLALVARPAPRTARHAEAPHDTRKRPPAHAEAAPHAREAAPHARVEGRSGDTPA
ncbi:MFS transporter [Streptomyces sp. BK79]|uniref:MFS transporter n=1 Tax=Streptomyces sp. BK79 TaxID=3350097 RepID=UPI0037701070